MMRPACCVLMLLCVTLGVRAQQRDSALSQAEIEKLRDTAFDPPERLLAFTVFLDDRAKSIDKLAAGRRHAGREDDIHDRMEQFSSIDDDLEDNLDDWRKRHRDLRHVLPKLVAAADRWATELRAPGDDERYNVVRKLALEGLAQTREDAQKLLAEQVEYFKTHKPDEDGLPGRHG
jgi:hypothetical protein